MSHSETLLTSFLYGGNADYIEDLYARFNADPQSVDPTWRTFFARLGDSRRDVAANAEGPSWQRPDWPQAANGELVSALDGNWGEIAVKAAQAVTAGPRPDAAPPPPPPKSCRRRAIPSAPS